MRKPDHGSGCKCQECFEYECWMEETVLITPALPGWRAVWIYEENGESIWDEEPIALWALKRNGAIEARVACCEGYLEVVDVENSPKLNLLGILAPHEDANTRRVQQLRRALLEREKSEKSRA